MIDYIDNPVDDKNFEGLKSSFIRSARRYIQDLYVPFLNVNSIEVKCIDADEYVNVYKERDGIYIVEFGESLLNSIYNVSRHLLNHVSKYFKTNNEDLVCYFCFNYISWIILNHELSHIVLGHVDYTLSKGEIGYIEISGRSFPILHLSDDLSQSRDIWRALETEADSIAFSSSLPTLKYINELDEWGHWDLKKVLLFHGVMNCSVFYLFNVLTKNNDDFKHLRASVRQYVTLPCLDKLAEQMKFKKEEFTDTVTFSNVKALIEIFGLKVSEKDSIEAYAWMNRMDDILQKSGIDEFRRYRVR